MSSEYLLEKKYTEYFNKDPFPEIPPSVLNSADIQDYIQVVGLLDPFDPKQLKPATYGIKPKGEYVYWDSNRIRRAGLLQNITETDEDGEPAFLLPKNSIAYLQLDCNLRLPYYISARFNLKIKHIYQGLLLGTGPIVDPGYQGKIYAPLHNLTNNDYYIKLDKTLIWMEFTKISPNIDWNTTIIKNPLRISKYIEYDKERVNQKQSLSDYINNAIPNTPISSTIVGVLSDVEEKFNRFEEKLAMGQELAKNSLDSAHRVTNTFNRAVILSIIAVTITMSISFYKASDLTTNVDENLRKYDEKIYSNELNQVKEIMRLQQELNSIKEIINNRDTTEE